MKKKLFLFVSILIFCNSLTAQTTKGKDFWLGFMYNLIDDAPLEVYVTAEHNVTGTVTIPGLGFSQTFNVAANSSTLITIPNLTSGAMANNASDAIEAKGIHVVTCDTVSVYAINKGAYSDDAAVIFPTSALGNYYRSLNINGNPGDWGKEFMVVATANGTQVQIVPSVATGGGKPAGVPYTVTLNQGDVYQVQSSGDLTGTTITGVVSGGSCQNFAVFSGSTCLNIGGCTACDHIYEQLSPVKQWGKNFCGGLFATKQSMVFRILADQNSTSFTINNGAPMSLNAGQFYEYNASSGGINDYSIAATKPVMVMQYMAGGQCDGGMGDPDHVLISPVEQTMNIATFFTIPSSVVTAFYLNVLVQTSGISSITLNGVAIPPASFVPISGNPTYSYARGIVLSQSTNYQLKSNGGFSAFVYGLGQAESYTYPVGTSVKDLLSDFTIHSAVNPPCPGSIINFTAINDPNATAYQWDFGDNTTATGLSTSHGYSATGSYIVTMTKSIPGSCDIKVQKTVNVLGPKIQINGNTVVCPHQNVTLTVPPSDTVLYKQITLCGDTIITKIIANPDSIVWSTGDTGNVIHVTPNQTTTYYAWGYTRGSTCFAEDSITVTVSHPTAAFIATKVCIGNATVYTDQSTPIAPSTTSVTTWAWDYTHDGIIDNQTQNPTNTFTVAGTFISSLLVSDTHGCKDSVQIPVTVYPNPVANFSVTPACFGNNNTFTSLSTIVNPDSLHSWNWSFGEGGNTSTTQNPSYTYTTITNANHNSTYTAQLIITSNHGCKDSIQKTVNVYALPIANFTSDSVCLNSASHLVDASNGNGNPLTSYHWDVTGDHVSDLTGTPTSYIFTSSGNNTVNYTVSTTPVAGLTCSHDTVGLVWVNPLPQAAFSYTSACINTQPTLFDASLSNVSIGSINTYSWNYGDTQTGNGVNVTHSYNTQQNFTTLLTVVSNKGCSDTISHIVAVYPKPSISFSVNPACFGMATTFVNTSTISLPSTLTNWAWSLGESGNTSTAQNPSYTYTTTTNLIQNTNYTAQLVATSNHGCKDSLSSIVTVYCLPTASFKSDTVCLHQTSHLTDISNGNGNPLTAYHWDVTGDNVSDLSGTPTSYVFTSVGSSLVNYTVSTSPISGLTCSNHTTLPVYVYPLPQPVFTYTNSCINTQPNVLSAINSGISSGSNILYLWNYGDGQSGTGITTTHTYNTPQNYLINLTVISNKGCLDSIAHTITIHPKPNAKITNTWKDCLGSATTFTANTLAGSGNIVNWQWDVDNSINTFEATGQNSAYTYQVAGSHTLALVTSTDKNCKDTIHQAVYVNYLPQVGFTINSTTGCSPHCVDLISSLSSITPPAQLVNWKWYFGDGKTLTANRSNVTNYCYTNTSHTSPENFNIKLVILSDSSCADSMTQNSAVSIYPNPKADFEWNPKDADVLEATISFTSHAIGASGPHAYVWNFGDIYSTSDSLNHAYTANPKHNYTSVNPSSYQVTQVVANTYGCKDSITEIIYIKDAVTFYIPNSFTPNGDGINEEFKGTGIGIKDKTFNLWVFDRWGLLLFHSDELEKGWNGTITGGPVLQEDVYVWKVSFQDKLNNYHHYNGTVTLMK